MRYHLESTHRTPQYQRCYSSFSDEERLIDHIQQQNPCSPRSKSLKEGINPPEWASIKNLLKAKKTKSASEKMDYEKAKWNELFKIIFPGVDLPESPCKLPV